jgi:hypothetical protein
MYHLMMEETDALLNESDAELLSGLKDSRVILTASWRSDILNSRAAGTENIVDEWELPSN